MSQELKSTLLYALAVAINQEEDQTAIQELKGAELALLQ